MVIMTAIRNKKSFVHYYYQSICFNSHKNSTYFQNVADRHDDVISIIEVNTDYPHLMSTNFTNQFACGAIPNLYLEV